MEKVKAEEWVNSNCFGYGDGSGDGSGYGSGYGDGYGYGSGYGDGDGDGYGCGDGDGSGYGDGYGDGCGYGSGYGSGYGDGYGSGYGIKTFNNYNVFIIDGIQTIITNIMGSYAKGFILESDFNLKPCYIAKGKGLFTHGNTLRKANEDLQNKIMQNLDIDEKIQIVIGEYEHGKRYSTRDFYKLHNFLTGSCEMGRSQFAKDHNIDLDGEMTMDEFIDLTEEAYGGCVIKQLKEAWSDLED